jgi:torulene dioxygenase
MIVPEKIFDYSSYDQKLTGQFSAAHHQWDPNTNETFNFTSTMVPKPRIIVFGTSESGKVTVLADITHRKDNSLFQLSYIHSFWVTKNYVIIPESPLTYQDKGRNMLLNGSILSSMTWVDHAPTWLHVISRTEGKGLVASIPVNPGFFTFHVGNAFDEVDSSNGDILLTLDSCSFADGDIMNQLHNFGSQHRKGPVTTASKTTYINGIAYPPRPQTEFGDLIQYKVNVSQSKLISSTTLARNVEFPRFNQQFATSSKSQIVYGCELKCATEKLDDTGGLIKVNTNSGAITRFDVAEGFSCSEPVFVPHPDAESEDGGVLLTLVNSFDRCYLIIVNALDMKELARFHIGQFIAVTFHGSYVDHEFKSTNIN